MELSKQEEKIIAAMRSLNYGELVVIMKEGKPIRCEVKESVIL